jgi:hypothetical protein
LKVLIRMGAEGGAVDVYRLYLGRWDRDSHTHGVTQVHYDAPSNVVTLQLNGRTERGTKMDPRDAKRLLAMFPPPWVEQEEAWDEGDELDEVVKRERQQNGTGLTSFERKMRVTKACKEDK